MGGRVEGRFFVFGFGFFFFRVFCCCFVLFCFLRFKSRIFNVNLAQPSQQTGSCFTDK